MTEGRLETESRCRECLAIIKGEVTSNNLSKRRVRTRTHGVVGGRGLVAPSYPIFGLELNIMRQIWNIAFGILSSKIMTKYAEAADNEQEA